MTLNIMPLVLYEHYSSLFSPFAFKNMLGAKNVLINSKSGAGIQFILNQGRKGLEILSCKEYFCLLTGCMGERALCSVNPGPFIWDRSELWIGSPCCTSQQN